MDNMIYAVINGEERPLNYSIEVMFNMTDKYGTIRAALEVIDGAGMESFDAVKWFAIQMANDAELCRRAEGYDARPMIQDSDITPRIRPVDYEALRGAVIDAITLGYKRELPKDEDEEIDVGLEELREKKVKTGE